jgi:uracil-DNA glycosylase
MKMMMEVDEYFDRATYTNIAKSNLFPCGRLPKKNKKGNLAMAAHVLIASVEGTNKKVVLLGNEVRDAVLGKELGKKWPSAKFTTICGARYAWVPHPSGRNPFYNDTRRRRRVGRFLVNAAKYRT